MLICTIGRSIPELENINKNKQTNKKTKQNKQAKYQTNKKRKEKKKKEKLGCRTNILSPVTEALNGQTLQQGFPTCSPRDNFVRPAKANASIFPELMK